ncbi:ADP-ribosylglycohydrolase family protein [Amycolatopsis echigonensis]|uniref:ADP-ribosylglycohydrolase n=1 Tax=Amycolatopsis echigonensis TaxID=2576905 RepID=A0A2N3WV53_9PSEU|nr:MULTISPECIES: ADP-ribosylglycohydrolase family protein [Amycolatopsis]MBB2497588.1 ADP-ribosylglycohydrolase family protein [Amycolatopsis echigonensis]PKV97735.1 ADP-ribosylglycohydrolase [Amycolatopsis niigatensis]
MRLTWAQPEDLLAHEFVQSAAEGRDVTSVRERWIAAGGDPVPAVSGAGPRPASPALRALARTLLDELAALPAAPSPGEPDGWDEILALLPAAPVLPRRAEDRTLGAWTGRAAGCLLGKPVEKIPREGIEEILRATGRWPLDRWFTAVGLPDDVAARWPWNRRSAPTSLEENISGMPEDDDLNYPILALTLLERHGREFTTDDVAQLWLEQLPAGRVFTAERAAYRNLLDARPVPETAKHLNPFREWIGALIRTDVFGWVSPGDVRGAARLAWVDARLSHTRNGIYGAIWAAALASAAMVVDSVHSVLDAAETVLPPESRLAEAVRFGREAAAYDDGLDRLHARYGDLHWVHVLNNAAVIAYALARGDGDFGQSISLAVTAGWDTDSAAATVGGVVGALVGVDWIGEQWTKPLDNRIATSLPGGEQRITDLAARTAGVAR